MDPKEFKKEDLKLIKELNKKTFSIEYEGEYHGNKYLIKKLSKDNIDFNKEDEIREYMKTCLKREIDIARQMSQLENSVKLYFNFEEEKDYVLIFELCDTDLSQLLDEKKRFSSSEILSIMKDLNNAFKYMYNNSLLHRNIKPENILIKYTDSSKTKFIPKIYGYGFSRELENGKASTEVGTPRFMAPEVIIGENDYDNKSDLYSIGVMMYYLYFGSYPFEIPKGRGIKKMKEIYDKPKKENCEDKVLDDLLNKLLAFEPEKRITWEEYLNHPFFNIKNQ